MRINTKAYDLILDYIKANPGATYETVKESNPRLPDSIVNKVLNYFLVNDVLVASDEDGGYSFLPHIKRECAA